MNPTGTTFGLDIGSRTTKLVIREVDGSLRSRVVDAAPDPLDLARRLLAEEPTWDASRAEHLVVTGYGRHLVGECLGAFVVSEIKAVAVGAVALHPACRTVVDVGGQDCKVLSVDASGRLGRFALNDRCAAGTGRSLEMLALALAWTLPEFAEAARASPRAERIGSTCAVFAESEVVSLIGRGAPRDAIARGVHEAAATRILALAGSVPVEDEILFVGGGALNPCLRDLLARGLGRAVVLPPDPRVVAATGCAILAARQTPSSD